MVNIEIKGSTVTVEMLGAHKLWALRSRIEVPIEHIVDVRHAPDASFDRNGMVLKMGGTAWPGVIIAGAYVQRGKWSFWDVCHKENTVAIDLRDERFSRLVVEVANPEKAVRAIRSAMAGSTASAT